MPNDFSIANSLFLKITLDVIVLNIFTALNKAIKVINEYTTVSSILLKFFIDGRCIAKINYKPSGNICNSFGIGWNNCSGDTVIKGNIHSVRFYNRALSVKEYHNNNIMNTNKYGK